MRRWLLVMGLFSWAQAAVAGDGDICAELQGERSISACTRLISSGQVKGQELARLYVMRGVTHRAANNLEAAIADFTHAIRNLEGTASAQLVASAYVTRGGAYALKDDLERSLADYRKAGELDPSSQQAQEGIKRTEAALSAPKAIVPEPPVETPAQRNFACCLSYYRGERSLEGWGPAERCRRNIAAIKADFCQLLHQYYPNRK